MTCPAVEGGMQPGSVLVVEVGRLVPVAVDDAQATAEVLEGAQRRAVRVGISSALFPHAS